MAFIIKTKTTNNVSKEYEKQTQYLQMTSADVTTAQTARESKK
jgi:hypothetical protein